jgi:hypothetical protein
MAAHKKIMNKKAAISQLWLERRAYKECQRIVEPAQVGVARRLRFQGGPTTESLCQGKEFGKRFAERLAG